MKICPTCHMEFDEAEGSCPVCEEMTRHEDPPAPEPLDPAIEPEPRPEDQLRLKALRDRLAAEAGAGGALAGGPADVEGDAREPDPKPREPEPARPVRETGDDEDMSAEEIAALAKSKLYVVGLLGFPAGGKTWFLNRLKWICQQRGDLTPIPEAAEDRKPAGQTIKIRPHRFLKKGSGFAVIDIPGERFLEAVRDKFAYDSTLLRAMKACDSLLLLLPADEALFAERADALHEGVELHEVSPDQQAAVDQGRADARSRRAFLAEQLKAATRSAAALRKATKDKPPRGAASELKAAEAEKQRIRAEIATLDADEGRAVGEHLASTNERLNLFVNGVGRMAGVLSMMDRAKFGDLPEAYSDAAVSDHILSDDFRPCDRPTFIALTKSDLLDDPAPVVRSLVKGNEDEQAVLDNYDLDPLHTVQTFRPGLANAFARWFHWSKFDFVTAFQGHKGDTVIRYATPHRGVDAVIEWIEWASGSTAWNKRDWGEIDLARMVRRFRDGGGPAHRKIGSRKGRQRE